MTTIALFIFDLAENVEALPDVLEFGERRGDVCALLVGHGQNECVEHAHGRRQRVDERDHLAAHEQRIAGHLVDGRHLAVRHADDRRAAVARKLDGLERKLTVAREADTDDHIAFGDAEELVERAGRAAVDQSDVVEDQAEVEV